MFLRASTRKKDGKEHRYYSVVENKRVSGGRVLQGHTPKAPDAACRLSRRTGSRAYPRAADCPGSVALRFEPWPQIHSGW